MSFTATLAGKTYTDAALFDVDATAWRKAQKMRSHDVYRDGDMTLLYGPPMRGESAALVEGIRKGWKAPRLTRDGKPFEPAGYEVGAWLSLRLAGREVVRAQVWSKAPRGGVWAVTNARVAFYVNVRVGIVTADAHGGYAGVVEAAA